jgi:hypothetical protein
MARENAVSERLQPSRLRDHAEYHAALRELEALFRHLGVCPTRMSSPVRMSADHGVIRMAVRNRSRLDAGTDITAVARMEQRNFRVATIHSTP